MRDIKDECRNSGGEISISSAEANRGTYHCPDCRRYFNMRVKSAEGGWPIGIIPRHSVYGPKDMTEVKRKREGR